MCVSGLVFLRLFNSRDSGLLTVDFLTYSDLISLALFALSQLSGFWENTTFCFILPGSLLLFIFPISPNFTFLFKFFSMQSLPTARKRHIDVNGVSLVDLKAEIARRQADVKAKATTHPDVAGSVIKRTNAGSGVEALFRPQPEKSVTKKETPIAKDSTDEDAEWEQARRKLEAKARLYEALKQAAINGTNQEVDSDDDKAHLVDFERKAMEENRFDGDWHHEDKHDDHKDYFRG